MPIDKIVKSINVQTAAIILTWFATICSGVWYVSKLDASVKEGISNIADHEVRIREVEKASMKVAEDVSWIRNQVESRWGRSPSPSTQPQ